MGPGDPFSKPAHTNTSSEPTMSVRMSESYSSTDAAGVMPERSSTPFQAQSYPPQSFQSPQQRSQHSPQQPHAGGRGIALPSLHRAGVSTIVGMVCGALLGIIALLSSWQGVLLVLVMSCVGGLVAWVIWSVQFNRGRWVEAWRVLRGRG